MALVEESIPQQVHHFRKRPFLQSLSIQPLHVEALRRADNMHFLKVISNNDNYSYLYFLQELFCVCGALKRARLVHPGMAEVVFVKKEDAITAYKKYNNRCLDGKCSTCPTRVLGWYCWCINCFKNLSEPGNRSHNGKVQSPFLGIVGCSAFSHNIYTVWEVITGLPFLSKPSS